jgi:hypothetical protein
MKIPLPVTIPIPVPALVQGWNQLQKEGGGFSRGFGRKARFSPGGGATGRTRRDREEVEAGRTEKTGAEAIGLC